MKVVVWKGVREYLLLTAGALVLALGMDLFLVPFRIAPGHIGGLAIITHHYLGLRVGVFMLLVNVPIFLLGVRYLGGLSFLAPALYTVFLYSLAVDLLAPWLPTNLTQDPLLATVYGGILMGVGGGLVFRAKGATGGLSILARLLHKATGIPLGQGVMFINAGILLLAGLAFNWERALYGLVALYIEGQGIDFVMEGFSYTRSVYIISDQAEKIPAQLLTGLGRGVTAFHGRGMYTRQEREILLCVVTQGEVSPLKELVYEVDPQAFLIVSPASEVVGRGFKPLEENP